MRKLHTNPRNYQEPFILLQTGKMLNEPNGISGVGKWVVKNKIQMWGSIMNRSLTFANSYQDDNTSSLSIKIINQSIDIKVEDRLVVNGKQYIIVAMDKDYYNLNDIIIKADFEKTYNDKLNITLLDFALNSKLVG